MQMFSSAAVLKWTGLGLLIFALALGAFLLTSRAESPVWRVWNRYTFYLDRKLRLMFIWTPGSTIALGQLGAAFVVVLLAVAVDLPLWWLWILLIALLPPFQIERMRQRRVHAIEEQLDGFLVALANALKATPSIANAFQSVQNLLPSPFREEVVLANKEMRVGSTLEQALLSMAGRIGSKQLDSAFSAILIGRQIGGDLPKILETTSSTLREMSRLEGVVKSKTAEGKAQLWVLALFPFVMVFALNSMSPGYFDPLGDSVVGWIIALAAGTFWLASLVVARKVLAVDV